MQFVIRRPAYVTGLLTAIVGLASSETTAQSDWWDKAKDRLSNTVSEDSTGASLSNDEIGAGLKDALRVGTESVVGQLGQVDGFNADPVVHIPLPDGLDSVQSALQKIGKSSMLDDLELRLNRAAETATPRAKELFWEAIEEMTLDDVMAIYEGPDDAATRYFQAKMSAPLAVEMRPIVDESLDEVGAVQAYDKVMTQYETLPFVPDAGADLTNYVVEKGMDGIFYYLAQEEAAIRQDPLKRTTDLLTKVFGSQ